MERTNRKKFFYIYNPEQADFFVKNGLTVIGVGKGSHNDVYIKFPRTEKEEMIFTKWRLICEQLK